MYDTKSRLFVMSVLSSNVDTSEIAPSASLRQTMLMKCKMADSMLSRFIVQAIRNRICSTNKKTIRTIAVRSEEHTSELQSLMRNSYAVFCLKKKKPHMTYHQ